MQKAFVAYPGISEENRARLMRIVGSLTEIPTCKFSDKKYEWEPLQCASLP
jgi:hypothetical protein